MHDGLQDVQKVGDNQFAYTIKAQFHCLDRLKTRRHGPVYKYKDIRLFAFDKRSQTHIVIITICMNTSNWAEPVA